MDPSLSMDKMGVMQYSFRHAVGACYTTNQFYLVFKKRFSCHLRYRTVFLLTYFFYQDYIAHRSIFLHLHPQLRKNMIRSNYVVSSHYHSLYRLCQI